MTENNSNCKEILDGIQAQIASFDNKASALLSVVGIVFALALSFLDVFHEDYFIEQAKCFKIWYYILFIIFLVATFFSIFSFAMVIFPRKHRSNIKHPNYYKDIIKMTTGELETKIGDYFKKNDLILSQIKINSGICEKKHKWTITGVLSLIPFVLSIIVLTIMTIFA